MKILILGSGGREHAFAWKITQSSLCQQLFVAPGNAGTAQIATNLPISYNDFEAIACAVLQHKIDLVLVGPEEPLVLGIRDFFETNPALHHVGIVGPNSKGAMLEGSKDFSKNFMHKYGIPTAASRTFAAETIAEGLEYLAQHSLPIVLKADGLAAGKGVIIAETHAEATIAFKEMLLEAKFGEASLKVVVEQFLEGIELSVFVLTDGTSYKILPEAKDYKRIGEGDTGLNTGGMGAVSPVPFATPEFLEKVENTIVKPTLAGLQTEGIKYIGFIFIGLMNMNGEPFVIEYNARMGDPETEAVLPRIESDMVTLLHATAQQRLHEVSLNISTKTAITTVLVAGGYPQGYEKDNEVTNIASTENTLVFHAGTKNKENCVVTNGGRVLAITALANDLKTARDASQVAAAGVQFKDKYYRTDIGNDVIEFSIKHQAI